MSALYPVTTDWLKARTEATPDDVALLVDGLSFTFRELDRAVTRLSDFLWTTGIRPGDHTGSLMSNCLAAVCTVFAAARIGAVLVPLNTRLTATEIAWQFDQADCEWLLCSTSCASVAFDAVDESISPLVFWEPATSFMDWLDSLPAGSGDISVSRSPDALQAIVFTSGTTGFPKGAMITFANHLWSAVGSAFKLGVLPGDRWLACMPLFHVGGLSILFRSCLYGTTVVLHNGFDLVAIRKSMVDDRITLISAVPTMLARLLGDGLTTADCPALRLVLLGGAAASPDLLDEAFAVGLSIAVTYGLTEACSQVATMLPDTTIRKPGSPGKPLLFTTVDIVADDGTSCPAYVPGEIVVTGPTIAAGYYRDLDATARTMPDGRLFTGDIGYLDDDGDLWVLSRRSDLIVSGGENVYPAEVERIIMSHPAVAAAAVVGLPHDEWGQQVAAMVVTRPHEVITSDELSTYLRERLAGYKRPRIVEFVEELPLTGSGKINRSEVVRLLSAQVETP